MTWFARSLVAAVLLLGPLTGFARAVTVQDLLALQARGLSDDILVALIETDGSSFELGVDDILALHDAGLSDRVLIAVMKARKKMPEAAIQSPADPTAAPVVHVEQTVIQRVDASASREPHTIFVPVAVPVVAAPHRSGVESRAPVYWGYGGKLRGDAWQPASDVVSRESKSGARTDSKPGESGKSAPPDRSRR
jgi:hypothetical protein